VGVKNSFIASDSEESRQILEQLSHREDILLVIITQRIAEKIEPLILEISTRQKYPLIVTIPDVGGPIARKVEPLKDLIKSAIGIGIKVQ